jgi:hypothetical protein
VAFFLWHKRASDRSQDATETKLIGIFDSPTTADESLHEVEQAEGFIDYPEGFSVEVIPVDQTLYDNDDSGVGTIVRWYRSLSTENETKSVEGQGSGEGEGSVGDPGSAEVFRRIIDLGSATVYNLIEELHQQVRDRGEIERLQCGITAAWMPKSADRRSTARSKSTTNVEEMSSRYWAFRRAGYPLEPEWTAPEHARWKQLANAHRQVLLLWDLNDTQILDLVVNLLDLCESDDERVHVRVGLLTSWLNGLAAESSVWGVLADRARSSEVLAAMLSEWSDRRD